MPVESVKFGPLAGCARTPCAVKPEFVLTDNKVRFAYCIDHALLSLSSGNTMYRLPAECLERQQRLVAYTDQLRDIEAAQRRLDMLRDRLAKYCLHEITHTATRRISTGVVSKVVSEMSVEVCDICKSEKAAGAEQFTKVVE